MEAFCIFQRSCAWQLCPGKSFHQPKTSIHSFIHFCSARRKAESCTGRGESVKRCPPCKLTHFLFTVWTENEVVGGNEGIKGGGRGTWGKGGREDERGRGRGFHTWLGPFTDPERCGNSRRWQRGKVPGLCVCVCVCVLHSWMSSLCIWQKSVDRPEEFKSACKRKKNKKK